MDQKFKEAPYYGVKFLIRKIIRILKHDFLQQNSCFEILFGKPKPSLKICGLIMTSVFINLIPDCKPTATKSKHYANEDKLFINTEITRMLKEEL